MPSVRRRTAKDRLSLPEAGTSVGSTLGGGIAVVQDRLAAATDRIGDNASRFVVPSPSTFSQSFSFAGGDEIDVDVPGPGEWAWWLMASCGVNEVGSVGSLDYVPVELQMAVVPSTGGVSWLIRPQIMASTSASGTSGEGGYEMSGHTKADSLTVGCGAVWGDSSIPGLPTFPGSSWSGVVRGLWLRPE